MDEGTGDSGSGDPGGEPLRRRVRITSPDGLHMRPCSILQAAAAKFEGTATLTSGDRSADLSSIFDLLSLGLQEGAEGDLVVDGPGAEAFIADVAAMFDNGFGDDQG